jgi:hypothetical protein
VSAGAERKTGEGRCGSVNCLNPSSPIHAMIVRPWSPADSDEGCIVMCMMLGASLTVSRLASSSSDSSGSKSTMASPLPVPDVVIYVVLPDISKVLEVELMPQDDVIETGPRTETSASEFFFQI